MQEERLLLKATSENKGMASALQVSTEIHEAGHESVIQSLKDEIARLP